MSDEFSIASSPPKNPAVPEKGLQLIKELVEADVVHMKYISDKMHVLAHQLPESEQPIFGHAMAMHLRTMLRILDVCEGKV
jgi:hypothetical protein